MFWQIWVKTCQNEFFLYDFVALQDWHESISWQLIFERLIFAFSWLVRTLVNIWGFLKETFIPGIIHCALCSVSDTDREGLFYTTSSVCETAADDAQHGTVGYQIKIRHFV